jgi:hypothetical protein
MGEAKSNRLPSGEPTVGSDGPRAYLREGEVFFVAGGPCRKDGKRDVPLDFFCVPVRGCLAGL